MIPQRTIALALPLWVLIQAGVGQAQSQSGGAVTQPPTPQQPTGPQANTTGQPALAGQLNGAGQPATGTLPVPAPQRVEVPQPVMVGMTPPTSRANQMANAPGATQRIDSGGVSPNYNPPFPQSSQPPLSAATRRNYDLMIAAFDGETSRVRDLLAKGARLEARDWKYGFTPLIWACENGHLGTVRYLLSKGAKVSARSYPNVQLILAKGVPEITATETTDAGQYIYANTKYLYTPTGYVTALMMAAAGGYGLTVQELLRHGADPNQSTGSLTPLTCAAFSGYMPAVQALLDKGAKVNDTATTSSPLISAVFQGHTPVVKVLLDHGAVANFKDNNGYTPRMFAEAYGYTSMARLLKRAEARQANTTDKGQAKSQTVAQKKSGLTADAHPSDLGIVILR